jgi:hypothetical protein
MPIDSLTHAAKGTQTLLLVLMPLLLSKRRSTSVPKLPSRQASVASKHITPGTVRAPPKGRRLDLLLDGVLSRLFELFPVLCLSIALLTSD